VSAIVVFGERSNGARACGFSVGEDIGVLITPSGREHNEHAVKLARQLADTAASIEAAESAARKAKADADEAVARAHANEERALAQVPPKSPARLMSTGYVRFDTRGGLWVLGKREHGFAAFGYRCDDWDDLFRRFNVRVTGHGTDVHGAWWSVENAAVSP
jgi:hypothetical protein